MMRTLGLVCVLAIVGCDREEVTLDDLPTELASAACGAFRDCGGGYFLPPPLGTDGCNAYLASTYRNLVLPPLSAAIEEGTIVYDGGAATECLAAYDQLGCSVIGGSSFTVAHVATCSRIFDGQVSDGGACQLDEECDELSYCAGLACPGTCEARTPAGASCEEVTECQIGYLCADGICAEFGTDTGDGTCAFENECGFGQTCFGATVGTRGQCRPYAELMTQGEGERCDFEAGQLCSSGLSCGIVGADVYECRAIAASGGACLQATPSMCPADHTCRPASGASYEGTCEPLRAEGEACVSEITPCGFGLRCIAGTCAAVAEIGEACTENSGCFSSRCEGGVCAGPDLCIAAP